VRTRLVVFLASLIAAALLLEIGLRVSGYRSVATSIERRTFALRPSAVPDLHYDLQPGAEGRLWQCDVKINSHGFRDREYAIEKAPGTTRIVALGDSITFGNYLPLETVWTERLEALYAKRGRPVEVLNLGVGGYDSWQEVRFLEQGRHRRPGRWWRRARSSRRRGCRLRPRHGGRKSPARRWA
jgi:hypothetical protein